MKNKYTIIILCVICLTLTGLLGYLWVNEMKNADDLQSQVRKAEDELNTARRKQSPSQAGENSAKEEETSITAKIPYNEREPFTFLKGLTRLASRSNMKNIRFTASAPEKYTGRALPASGSSQKEGFFSISITMNAEGEFHQLVGFLKQLYSQNRIVTMDAIQVARDEKILPCQKITLKLKVYTYLAPDPAL